MGKRLFLQQCYPLRPGKDSVAGYFGSEKLDGHCVFWDGGATAGMPASQVPWANIEKDARYVTPPTATGLWSRYGNVIHAPKEWTKTLPNFPLVGEAWMGRGLFQKTSSILKQLNPNYDDWKKIRFKVFDSPDINQVMCDGVINEPNYKKVFRGFDKWFWSNANREILNPCANYAFRSVYKWLEANLYGEYADLHPQEQLPLREADAQARLGVLLEEALAKGGEGLIVRSPHVIWIPERVHSCMKVKPYEDDEGIIVGYTSGRATELGSKLLGMVGALIVEWKGKRFKVSGLSNEERALNGDSAIAWASAHPGEEVPSWVEGSSLKRGLKITFRYRELTVDGVPKEARFKRIKIDL